MVECNLTSSSSSTPLSPLHSNRNPSPSNPHRWSNKHPLEYTLQLPLRTRQRRLHIDRPVPGPLDDQLLRFRPPSIATFVTSGTMPSFSHRRSLAAAWICRITSRMIALSIEICLYSCSARCPCGCRNGCSSSPLGPSMAGRFVGSRCRQDFITSSSQGFLLATPANRYDSGGKGIWKELWTIARRRWCSASPCQGDRLYTIW